MKESDTKEVIVGWSEEQTVNLGFDTVRLHNPLLQVVCLGRKDEANMVYRDSVVRKAIVEFVPIETV